MLASAAAENHGLGVGGSALWSPLSTSNGAGSRFMWSDKPYSAAIGTAGGACRNNNNNCTAVSKLLNLDMEDDEKDIENGMLEISKKLATELVDDDFAT